MIRIWVEEDGREMRRGKKLEKEKEGNEKREKLVKEKEGIEKRKENGKNDGRKQTGKE